MRKHNGILGTGLAVVAIAVMATSACDPYEEANTSQPQILGVAVIDTNFNEASPVDTGTTCTPAYAEPDHAWAASTWPGLCSEGSFEGGLASVCPVTCYPPRVGPAYAPFFTGNLGGSYQCQNYAGMPADDSIGGTPVNNACGAATGTVTYQSLFPAGGNWVLNGVPTAPVADPFWETDFLFAQVRILFNKTMSGATIQPDPEVCTAKAASPSDPTFVSVSFNPIATDAADGTDVTPDFDVCYNPNSAVSFWGASITATCRERLPTEPASAACPGEDGTATATPALAPNAKYTVRGLVRDQQGNQVNVNVVIRTAAP
jgi:hypothetical protein